LKLAVVGGMATAAAYFLFKNPTGSSSHICAEYDLDCIAANLASGGPPRDGIPSIDSPKFITGAQAEAKGWVSDNSLVDAIATPNDTKAYPRSITAWHEIVNDRIDSQSTSLTFCPLTGSAIAYRGKAPDQTPLTFGTTGLLYNSNLVMYDRQTNGLYPQILGLGISGPNKGVDLETVPVTTTTWKDWKAQHQDSMVLSRDTGYLRDYNTYPYGNYDSNDSIYFPVGHQSPEYTPKTLVSGIRIGREAAAIVKYQLHTKLVVDFALAGEHLVALYDPLTDYVRVFAPSVNGSNHTFTIDNSAGVIDMETGSHWSPNGEALDGPLAGTRLQQKGSFQVMWFGWYAFHPSTALVT
jgi:uncharacterized protein DUF3179